MGPPKLWVHHSSAHPHTNAAMSSW